MTDVVQTEYEVLSGRWSGQRGFGHVSLDGDVAILWLHENHPYAGSALFLELDIVREMGRRSL